MNAPDGRDDDAPSSTADAAPVHVPEMFVPPRVPASSVASDDELPATQVKAPKLRERPLGESGLDVSELALGTWGLSGDGYGPIARSEAEGTIARAIELGITLFETSASYGKGAMESTLGRVLEPHAASTLIATRHGVDRSESPARKRFDPAFLERSFTESQERLRRATLDLYLLHNPTIDPIQRIEVLAFVRGLKRDGKVRAWGVSAGSVEVARAAIKAGADCVSLTYNALFQSDMNTLASEIAEKRVGVLAHSVLAFGMLTGHWPRTKTFQPGDHRRDRWTEVELFERVKQLAPLRSLQGGDVLTLRSVALRFVQSNQLVSSVVLGPKSITQLDQLVREAGKGPPYLDEEKLAQLPERLAELGVEL